MKPAVFVFIAALAVATGLAIATALWLSNPDTERYRELRDLNGFTEIVVTGDIELKVTQGDVFLVEVEAADDALGGLHTLIDGTTLDIHLGAGSRRFFGLFQLDYEVSVTMPALTSLTASHGAEVDARLPIRGDRIAIIARYDSEMDLNVDVASIILESSRGSDIDIDGSAETATLRLSGGSELDGRSFAVREASIEFSGGSAAVLTVTTRITGTASGGSELAYQGNPATVDVTTTGGAQVTRLQ